MSFYIQLEILSNLLLLHIATSTCL